MNCDVFVLGPTNEVKVAASLYHAGNCFGYLHICLFCLIWSCIFCLPCCRWFVLFCLACLILFCLLLPCLALPCIMAVCLLLACHVLFFGCLVVALPCRLSCGCLVLSGLGPGLFLFLLFFFFSCVFLFLSRILTLAVTLHLNPGMK